MCISKAKGKLCYSSCTDSLICRPSLSLVVSLALIGIAQNVRDVAAVTHHSSVTCAQEAILQDTE